MIESLRARLLLWHTATVVLVVTLLSATVCFIAWRARLVDIDAALQERARVLSAALHPVGPGTFDLILIPHAARDIDTTLYHVISTSDGVLIDRSDADIPVPLATAPGVRTREGRREMSIKTGDDVGIVVGRDLVDVRREIYRLAATLLAVGAGVLVLSVAGGWLMTGRALGPIARISRTARRMASGDLSARIPVDRVETELEQVARALNQAFDELHASLDRQRQLTADVSHELRTPLATLSSEVQWALAKEREGGDYRESLETCRRAGARMQGIVERLLSLARAESRGDAPAFAAVPFDDVVRRVVAELAPLAENRAVTTTVSLVPAVVSGDADRLREAVTNVMTNALRYNVDGGRIDVTMTATDDSVALVVADSGVGISSDDLPRVFDPFFRADPARSRDLGGAGLGLAVTRAIIAAHSGVITCVSELHHGTTITIRLPRTA